MRAASAPPTPANQPETAAKPEVPPRFHVLITDGVQYTRQASNDQACASGADAFCVRKKILELLAQGWGGSVIGLRSQFCCAFFSESAQKAVPFNTQSRSTNGFRPFYLYVFSPDKTALSRFVARLKESLRKAAGAHELSLHELPITPAYAEGTPGFENGSFSTEDKTKLTFTKLNDAEREPLYLSLRLRTDSKAVKASFSLTLKPPWSRHALDCGSPQELAGLLQWELLPVYPPNDKKQTGRHPEIKLDAKSLRVNEQGEVVLSASAEWPLAAGEPCWRAYRLVGRLNPDAEPPWVREWSTDRDVTSEAGNRTLGLTSALLGLWRNPVLKDQVVVEAYLRVGPQN